MVKSLGSVFLIVGTTVGAGMPALPLITSSCGLFFSIVLMIISWSVMYLTGLSLIKICANQPLGVNFTSLLAGKIPKSFQVILTIIYLLLLYSLMAAYTTQGASLVKFATHLEPKIFNVIDSAIFILIFGIVILSVNISDYMNRSFLLIKLSCYLLCVISMMFFLKQTNIFTMPVSAYSLLFAWPTLLPSFGFQNVIPVLYEFHQGDIKIVKKNVLIGSLIVLMLYIIWIFVCLTILPQQGEHSYEEIFKDGNTLTLLTVEIKQITQSNMINVFLLAFINISVITSFICVGVSLHHYIRDILKCANIKMKKEQIISFFLTFTPPFIFSTFYPYGFILALQYAAIFAVIIFIFIPLYLDKKISTTQSFYPLFGGIMVIFAQTINFLGIYSPF